VLGKGYSKCRSDMCFIMIELHVVTSSAILMHAYDMNVMLSVQVVKGVVFCLKAGG
jgi:hypothetical protein